MKRKYLKEKIENFLINIELIIIAFFCLTIENIGNFTYDLVAGSMVGIFILITIVLNKYSKTFNED